MKRKHLQNFDVSWGHEPLERGCVEDQPQQSRSGNMLRLVEDDTAALRFMESLHDFMIAHWAHEPPERGCVEDQPQQSRSGNVLRLVDDDTAALRFMERKHLQNFDVSWGHEPCKSKLVRATAQRDRKAL